MTAMTSERSQPTGARGRIGRPLQLWRTAVIGLAVALPLAACGGGSAVSTTSTTTATTAAPVTLPSVKVSTADIKHAYTTLFMLTNPSVPPKLAVVQDGSTLKAAFTAAVHSALAKEAAGATVEAVKIDQGAACTNEALPSPCAAVTYDILGPSGTPVLTGSKGGAVYLGGQWLVAKATICSLLTLEKGGVEPPGC
jgi:hypothetical protein